MNEIVVSTHAVRLALAEGRQSTRRPEFLGPGSDARRGGLYVWTGDERAAFIVLPHGGGRHVVMTALTAFALARTRADERVYA